MRTQREIAQEVCDESPGNGEPTVDIVLAGLEAYRVELMREFDNDILEALAAIEESTSAAGMEEVFAARDQANDVLDRVGRTLRGQDNHR